MQISSSTSSPYPNNYKTGSASGSTSISGETPSSVKQFAYGALGLDSPDTQSSDTNEFYTAGKWVEAAVTIGRIVSLFV